MSTFEVMPMAMTIGGGMVDGGRVITRTVVGMLFLVGVIIVKCLFKIQSILNLVLLVLCKIFL